MITVGNEITRIVSCFKKISPEVSKVDEDNEIVTPNPLKQSIHSCTPDAKQCTLPELSSQQQIPIPTSGRGQRIQKLSRRFKDIVIK